MTRLIDRTLQRRLCCPHDGSDLSINDAVLRCEHGHQFPVVNGVPVLLVDDMDPTIELLNWSKKASTDDSNAGAPYYIDTLGISPEEKECLKSLINSDESPVDPVASFLVGATGGYMYVDQIGAMSHYPIPEIRLPECDGELLLDLGCSWGRWSISAARKGYSVIGLDPSLGAVLAAKRITESMGLEALFVVADARAIPFKPDTFDVVFSYSVLQYFSHENLLKALSSIEGVLHRKGSILIQMASSYGLRSIYHLMRRGFRKTRDFEVRYWSPGRLRKMFSTHFQSIRIQADCYLGLGLQQSDKDSMSGLKRYLLSFSAFMTRMSTKFRLLAYLADSLYLSNSQTRK